jgi:hypothetical protein
VAPIAVRGTPRTRPLRGVSLRHGQLRVRRPAPRQVPPQLPGRQMPRAHPHLGSSGIEDYVVEQFFSAVGEMAATPWSTTARWRRRLLPDAKLDAFKAYRCVDFTNQP